MLGWRRCAVGCVSSAARTSRQCRGVQRLEELGHDWQGAGMLVCFGLFNGIGGAYLQMWQAEPSAALLRGTFELATSFGVVMLIVNMRNE
ncbi:MAG: DUF2165 family protein [Gammaproteobacteria bacterium]|nr:MAG: DUF2165 family protein [Gammaproteobacteria bacterium]